jgi:hypothetical protein
MNYFMKKIHINNKDKDKDNITFGILFFILFLIIGLYPLISSEPVRIWSIILSLVILTITIIKPNLFTFLNKLWIQLGILLGKIISPTVMGLVFFLVVTPIGIFVRILKKDVMGLKKEGSSYWIDRKDKLQSMKQQF